MLNEEQSAINSSYGRQLLAKWHKVIEADGGISNQYMAEQTAILLENYLSHLNENPTLIAEDEIQTGNFKGVNLALLGLIRRTIPTLIAADMVGMQSMPTPTSPIFYLVFKKAFDSVAGSNGLSPKGASVAGQELWGYPSGGNGNLGEIDPYFTSNFINVVPVLGDNQSFQWTPVISSTVRLVAYDKTTGAVVASAQAAGSYDAVRTATLAVTISGDEKKITVSVDGIAGGATTYDITEDASGDLAALKAAYDIKLEWEYFNESNSRMPELTLSIENESVRLIKRNLRGKYTFDAMQDAKVLHGISLDTELMEMMRLELTNEISREIIKDLRTLAAIRKEISYTQYATNNVVGNYEDTHRFLLDSIAAVASEIYTQGRLGKGNFVVGNPSTLAFLERVNGFLGSGVDYDGNALTYKGKLGKLRFYEDPQYPKNELLIGYKGNSALDTGYIFAPYQPIVAMPTLYDPMTSDMRKIFQTRYGKSYQFVTDGQYAGTFRNAIYRGGYQYATLKLNGFPQFV
jgi:hypothetical protein